MPVKLDRQLKEYIPLNDVKFPIAYFHDELVGMPDWTGPLHWHPDFEIATAEHTALDYQVGDRHVILEAGDSIFVNGNILHGIKQLPCDVPDPMPNIVFSGTLVAPETSTLYQKYIRPIAQCDSLPFVVFRQGDRSCEEAHRLIRETYRCLSQQTPCYELVVQRNISQIFEYLFRNLDTFPKLETSRVQLKSQIRLQKMLTYIYEHYAETVTLEQISSAAHISRSEAGRCFRTYMGCSPVDALIQYRLQTAHRLLSEQTLTVQEICFAFGFHSVNYFSRQFKKAYGYTPGQNGRLGK